MTTPTTAEQIDAVLAEFSDTARSSTAVTQVASVSLDEHAIARALIDARATIARLEGELQERTEDYHRACSTIAAMHAAAVGEITGPRRGAVEDVEDVRTRADAAERRVEAVAKGLKAVETLISASRGVIGLHLNGDEAPWEDLRTGGRFEEWLLDFDTALAAASGDTATTEG